MTTAADAAVYWDAFAQDQDPAVDGKAVPERFGYTQYANHGPGVELLHGPDGRLPGRVLDLGCGAGWGVAWLAHHGVKATGLDFSPHRITRARQRWAALDGLTFVEADAVEFLNNGGGLYDAVYSVFGAAWFTDPKKLIPAVAKGLVPGGRLVFAHPPPVPGCTGKQGMWQRPYRGEPKALVRYEHTPAQWTRILTRYGFTDIAAAVLPGPKDGDLGTLIIRARSASPAGLLVALRLPTRGRADSRRRDTDAAVRIRLLARRGRGGGRGVVVRAPRRGRPVLTGAALLPAQAAFALGRSRG